MPRHRDFQRRFGSRRSLGIGDSKVLGRDLAVACVDPRSDEVDEGSYLRIEELALAVHEPRNVTATDDVWQDPCELAAGEQVLCDAVDDDHNAQVAFRSLQAQAYMVGHESAAHVRPSTVQKWPTRIRYLAYTGEGTHVLRVDPRSLEPLEPPIEVGAALVTTLAAAWDGARAFVAYRRELVAVDLDARTRETVGMLPDGGVVALAAGARGLVAVTSNSRGGVAWRVVDGAVSEIRGVGRFASVAHARYRSGASIYFIADTFRGEVVLFDEATESVLDEPVFEIGEGGWARMGAGAEMDPPVVVSHTESLSGPERITVTEIEPLFCL